MKYDFDIERKPAISQIVPFRAPDGTPYADVYIAGRRETVPIRGKSLARRIQHGHYLRNGSPMKPAALKEHLAGLEAEADFHGVERDVFLRTARYNDRLYIDLCDAAWRAIEIDRMGWRIVAKSPVRFLRSSATRALPEPVSGGSIDELWKFVRIADPGDQTLVVAHLLSILGAVQPTPILYLVGGQGTAKSAATALLRRLVDPNVVGLKTLPRSEQDLFVAAQQSRVLSFDNLSDISNPMSDALCRIVTGGAFGSRRYWTHGEEAILAACNPIICNGITMAFTRPDLLDRTICVRVDKLRDGDRKPNTEISSDFDRAHPAMLGALCTALSNGLAQESKVALPSLPRMADFAAWALACEAGFAAGPGILDAYHKNIEAAVEDAVDDDDVGKRIRNLMTLGAIWEGTATMLDDALRRASVTPVPRSWPGSPRALADHLRRLEPALAKLLVEISFARKGHNRERVITISMPSDRASQREPIGQAAST